MPLADVMAAFRSVGADLDLRVRWHGEALDRLLDSAHADLANDVVVLLSRKGWTSAIEVTFNEYGERGAIDVLAWHQGRGVLLVVELKTVVPDVQAMISSHDRKVRLGSKIGQQRGWDAKLVGGLLVIRDARSARRRIEERRDLFERAYPQRGRQVLRWLRDPSGPCAGILFLPIPEPRVLGDRRPAGSACGFHRSAFPARKFRVVVIRWPREPSRRASVP